MFNLSVGVLGLTAQKKVDVAPGTTVAEAFRLADISIEANYQLKLNGEVVSQATVITASGILVASPQIKGN